MSQHEVMDRRSPGLRPAGSPLMLQSWHNLGFFHWEVSVEALREIVPSSLEIDLFDGKAYVGLVPFTLTGVRPRFVPAIPFVSEFHEVNVRTYVHLNGRDPGVWFFSLDASSQLAVTAARTLFRLPYFHSEIDFSASEDGVVQFESRRLGDQQIPANSHLLYRPAGDARQAQAGSLDDFLIERYILYAADEDALYRARVHHKPYLVAPAKLDECDETLVWASGVKRPERDPIAHYSPGVDVEVFALERVE